MEQACRQYLHQFTAAGSSNLRALQNISFNKWILKPGAAFATYRNNVYEQLKHLAQTEKYLLLSIGKCALPSPTIF